MKHSKEKPKQTERKTRGISIRKTHILMTLFIVAISMVLLVASYQTENGYRSMRETTDEYVTQQHNAYELQTASDYLTEQVRSFADTGERQYLDNYFYEADVRRRRDRAVESLEKEFGGTTAYDLLRAALDQSNLLMNREFYSMRLTIDAYGYDPADFPERVRDMALSEHDAALSQKEKGELARAMVFDRVYHSQKESITNNLDNCIKELMEEMGRKQESTAEEFRIRLIRQRILIIVLIALALIMAGTTLFLIIRPLLRAVNYIRADRAIPIRGSDEFSFLAENYNQMYETNREQRENLAYSATHDKLTGVFNRRGYDLLIAEKEMKTAALIVLDIDHFKQINDTNGHEVGDRILKKVARSLKEAFRSADHVCRIGGDEFAVLLRDADRIPAEMICRKIEGVNDHLRIEEGDLPAVSVSAGAAYCSGRYPGDVFEEADAALYRVKRSGGSRCEVVA